MLDIIKYREDADQHFSILNFIQTHVADLLNSPKKFAIFIVTLDSNKGNHGHRPNKTLERVKNSTTHAVNMRLCHGII